MPPKETPQPTEIANPDKYFIERRIIEGTAVTFAGMEHKKPYPLEELEKAIGENEKLLLEYYPRELEKTVFNAGFNFGSTAREFSRAYGITDFFNKAEEIAQQQGKDIMVVDPATNALWPLYEVVLPQVILGASALQAVLMLGDKLAANKVQIDPKKDFGEILAKELKRQTTRRSFLKKATGAGLVYGLMGASMHLENSDRTRGATLLYRDASLNMRDLRWVTIAQGIVQICKEERPAGLTVVYPPAHFQDGIFHYLENPQLRVAKFAAYSAIPGVVKEIRNYSMHNGQHLDLPSKRPIRIS